MQENKKFICELLPITFELFHDEYNNVLNTICAHG
jgi:hypothetical protein